MEVTHKKGLPRGPVVSRFSVREVTGNFQYQKGNAGIQSIPKLSPPFEKLIQNIVATRTELTILSVCLVNKRKTFMNF